MSEALKNTNNVGVHFPEAFNDAKRLGADFLVADLTTALLFMDVAHHATTPEKIRRNHEKAYAAYETVLGLLQKLSPNPAQQKEIDDKLALLEKRLTAAGYKF